MSAPISVDPLPVLLSLHTCSNSPPLYCDEPPNGGGVVWVGVAFWSTLTCVSWK